MDSHKVGNYEVGYKKPPKNRQFGQPDGNKRSNGAWRKEETARYRLEQMIQLTEPELKEVFQDKSRPLFERKLAGFINKGDWKTYRDMLWEVYGKPKEVVETIDTTPKAIEVQVLAPKDDAKSGKPVEKAAENAKKNS